MKKNKINLITYITALSILISGCKMGLENIFFNSKNDISKKTYTNSSTETNNETSPSIIETINETETITIIEQTITEPKEIIDNIEPTIEETNPTIEQTEPTIPNIQNQIVSATTELNIRSSNTAESLKIGNLKIYETAIKILSCDNNWDLIKHDDGIGYVCNDYLNYTEEYIETEYVHEEYKDIVLTKTELNFRTSPTTESEIILTFDENTELQVVAKVNNEWLLVKYNENFGYVHRDYTISLLDKINEQYPELNLLEIDIKKVIYTNATELNIRTGNSINYDIIGDLETFESARVIEEYEDWYLILTNEYNIGFINKKYTKVLNDLFVIVDISKQRLYMYYNNELCYIAPVTTGKNSTPSDIGLDKIWYMGENEEIIPGYFVDYWMPYNLSMEGLHDAERWRKDGYGTEIYKFAGSNGCINMKLKDARIIYNNVSIGTKVLVHK